MQSELEQSYLSLINALQTQQITPEKTLLSMKGWEARYQNLIRLGKHLPIFPLDLKNEVNEVKGCESKVWCYPLPLTSPLKIAIDSEAKILRGVILLIQEQYLLNQNTDSIDWPRLFHDWQLDTLLSPSRSNGIRTILQQFKQNQGD